MNDSDQFIDWQLQLTHYRDPSTKVGVLDGEIFKGKKRGKTAEKRLKRSGAPWRMTG